ncbi:MAG: radical SAM protein [Nitrospirae bacterium]|nr:MAG: radical SAM protein [Nitrospirota bacterium]
MCIVYPNVYGVGMASLGYQGIYRLLNLRNDVVCERAFVPDDKDLAEYRRTDTPIFSLESKRPLGQFDIVAFSIAFENDYPNIVRVLAQSRIPLLSHDRTAHHPVVIGGGVCATINPEPFADFFDLLFVGDAEQSLPAFLDLFVAAGGRRAGVAQAGAIPGIYVPSRYEITYGDDGSLAARSALSGAPEGIRRQRCDDISCSPVSTAIVSSKSEFADMFLVEAMRGCPWSCRFCMVGNVYRPVRQKSLAAIREEIGRAKEQGCRVGIVGPSLTDYQHIEAVLAIDGVEFSLTSLRAQEKSARLLDQLAAARSISIAPEAGTERMRKVINKKVTETDIVETAALIFARGISHLRLYFMIGLPTERDEDILGIVDLIARIRSLCRHGKITAGISTFVPKPFTPFQWCAMDRPDNIKKKLRLIKKAFRMTPGVRIVHDVPKYAYMQGLFARGDRRLTAVLSEMELSDDYTAACRQAGIDLSWYVFRERGKDEVLPWDFIDAGVTKDKLWEEYQKALSVSEGGQADEGNR